MVWLILALLLNWGPERSQEKSGSFSPHVRMGGGGADEVVVVVETKKDVTDKEMVGGTDEEKVAL